MYLQGCLARRPCGKRKQWISFPVWRLRDFVREEKLSREVKGGVHERKSMDGSFSGIAVSLRVRVLPGRRAKTPRKTGSCETGASAASQAATSAPTKAATSAGKAGHSAAATKAATSAGKASHSPAAAKAGWPASETGCADPAGYPRPTGPAGKTKYPRPTRPAGKTGCADTTGYAWSAGKTEWPRSARSARSAGKAEWPRSSQGPTGSAGKAEWPRSARHAAGKTGYADASWYARPTGEAGYGFRWTHRSSGSSRNCSSARADPPREQGGPGSEVEGPGHKRDAPEGGYP